MQVALIQFFKHFLNSLSLFDTDPSSQSFCKNMETEFAEKSETEVMEGVQSHQDAYESSGDDCDGNEGGQPQDEDDDDVEDIGNSVNLNSFEEEKVGLRSPFEQGGTFIFKKLKLFLKKGEFLY